MIKYFVVYGLFGKFDNQIVFNQADKITLLIGPNGCGKTTTLKILKCVFMDSLNELRKYDFDKIEIAIDDSKIRIEKDKETPHLKSKIDKNTTSSSIYGVFKIFLNDKSINYSYSHNSEKYLDKIFIKEHLSLYESDLNEYIVLDDNKSNVYVERFLPRDFNEKGRKIVDLRMPDEIKTIMDQISIDFVSTNRLLKVDTDSEISLRDSRSHMHYKNMVEVYSNELVKKIKDTLSEYANISQKLDEAFPAKIFEAIKGHTLNMEDRNFVASKIDEISSLRDKHIKTGILESNETTKYITDSSNTLESNTLPILKVYYKDTEEKLKFLNDLSDRILLFIDLVNRKLMYGKQLIITKEKGLRILEDEKIITLSQLSSGEQQEIVLLYRLIFSSKENQIILIDEPEISLHVAWQRQFVDDLKEIIKLNNNHMVVATHSPQILNDNWDLTVELGEVE